VEQPQPIHLRSATDSARFANDSRREQKGEGGSKRKRSYVTAARVTAIRDRLKPKDYSIIADIARVNLLSGKQVRKLHYEPSDTGRRMARLDLKRLAELSVLTRIGRDIGGRRAGSEGFVYGIGTAGRRILGPSRGRPREAWTPSQSHVNHVIAVADIYVRLRHAETQGLTVLETFDAEPACWRSYFGPGGARLTLKPDAYVVTASGDYLDSAFIELDRATEPLPRIRDKAKAYARYWQSGREQEHEGVFPIVLFIVPNEHRRGQIIEALSEQSADSWHLFQVVTNDAAIEAIIGGPPADNQRREVNS
jgi:hypothetical protein